jgi:NADP-dependent 3-hydroxy acid dehydrogenase YdfG
LLPAPIEQLRQEDWNAMIGINMIGLMNAIHTFLPHWWKQASGEWPT